MSDTVRHDGPPVGQGSTELAPGTMVNPNIRLVRLLGRGGMGSVWVADHLTLETQVAVKFIHGVLATPGSPAAERFSREARVAAKLKSPHVVQTLDHGWMTNGTPYIVMELLEGESLLDRIARRPLSGSEAVLLVNQVGEVLHRAHALGVVHRDIKPHNLFLIESGYELFVKVLDFGIARQDALPTDQRMTQSGAIMGTPLYMSPELIRSSKEADGHADLWALAVTTYESLAGTPPFGGETIGALMLHIASGSFEPLCPSRPDLPPGVDAWMRRALHLDLSTRYPGAREMADAFAAAVRGADIEGPTLGSASGQRPNVAPHLTPNPPGAPAATFSGSASTWSGTPVTPSRAPWILGGALLVAALGVAMYFTIRGDRRTSDPSLTGDASGAPATSADEAPALASSAVPAEKPPEVSVSADPVEPSPGGKAPSAAPPSAKPASSTAPSPPPAKPAGNCEGDNMFVMKAGKLKIRPECQ